MDTKHKDRYKTMSEDTFRYDRIYKDAMGVHGYMWIYKNKMNKKYTIWIQRIGMGIKQGLRVQIGCNGNTGIMIGK